MITPGGTGHSEDGRWWWNGFQWLPAVSADGRRWFDGRRWRQRKAPRSRGSIALLVVAGVVWAGALSAAPALVFHALQRTHWVTFPAADHPLALGLGVFGAVVTVAVGVILGRQESWVALPIAAVGGTAVLAGWYIAMMDASYPPNDPNLDNGEGAGLAIYGVPALAAVCALLGLGMLAGRVTRRSKELVPPPT